MPNLEDVQAQIQALDILDDKNKKVVLLKTKVLQRLAAMLQGDEQILAISHGALGENSVGVVFCTQRRVAFTGKGLLLGGHVTEETLLDRIESVDVKEGLALGMLRVWDGTSMLEVRSIDKQVLGGLVETINASRAALSDSAES